MTVLRTTSALCTLCAIWLGTPGMAASVSTANLSLSLDGVLKITFDFDVDPLDVGPGGLTGIDVSYDFWDPACTRCTDDAASAGNPPPSPDPHPEPEPPTPLPDPPPPLSADQELYKETVEERERIYLERLQNKQDLDDGSISQSEYEDREEALKSEDEAEQAKQEELKKKLTREEIDRAEAEAVPEIVIPPLHLPDEPIPDPPEPIAPGPAGPIPIEYVDWAPFPGPGWVIPTSQIPFDNGFRLPFETPLDPAPDGPLVLALGGFSGETLGMAVHGSLFTGDPTSSVTYVASARTSGVVAPVPVPAAALMLLAGLGALGLVRARARREAS